MEGGRDGGREGELRALGVRDAGDRQAGEGVRVLRGEGPVVVARSTLTRRPGPSALPVLPSLAPCLQAGHQGGKSIGSGGEGKRRKPARTREGGRCRSGCCGGGPHTGRRRIAFAWKGERGGRGVHVR
jgi:hypothetical protein